MSYLKTTNLSFNNIKPKTMNVSGLIKLVLSLTLLGLVTFGVTQLIDYTITSSNQVEFNINAIEDEDRLQGYIVTNDGIITKVTYITAPRYTVVVKDNTAYIDLRLVKEDNGYDIVIDHVESSLASE
jgi:translation initiation factor 2 alpha subunit (eIF-2alpha)